MKIKKQSYQNEDTKAKIEELRPTRSRRHNTIGELRPKGHEELTPKRQTKVRMPR